MARERTPLSSLIGKKIAKLEWDSGSIKMIDTRGKVLATVSSHNWTLFDKNGNYFEDDSQ